MAAIMSQNWRKMAKTMHNAAKKFNWGVIWINLVTYAQAIRLPHY